MSSWHWFIHFLGLGAPNLFKFRFLRPDAVIVAITALRSTFPALKFSLFPILMIIEFVHYHTSPVKMPQKQKPQRNSTTANTATLSNTTIATSVVIPFAMQRYSMQLSFIGAFALGHLSVSCFFFFLQFSIAGKKSVLSPWEDSGS